MHTMERQAAGRFREIKGFGFGFGQGKGLEPRMPMTVLAGFKFPDTHGISLAQKYCLMFDG